MITLADIENMSREEKLRAMEALWQEISKEDPAPESPAWHGEVLKQPRSRAANGTEQVVDWGKESASNGFSTYDRTLSPFTTT